MAIEHTYTTRDEIHGETNMITITPTDKPVNNVAIEVNSNPWP